MSPSRFYSAGVRAALFTLSRGRCYAPKCTQQVTRFIDGEPSINIQIAHIHALDDKGPRFVATLSIPKRNSFANLLLLCQAHHNRVDSKAFEDKYPATLLRQWKRDREGKVGDELEDVQIKDNDALRTLFTDVLHATKVELLEAIRRVEKVSLDQAAMLRTLLDESFGQPQLNEDAIASLERSANVLLTLEDTAGLLHIASESINEDTVASIRSAADELNTAVDEAKYLGESLTSTLQTYDAGSHSAEQGGVRVYQVDEEKKWLYFLRGVVLGAALVGALVLAIVITKAVGGA